MSAFFFFNDTATTEIYTLSLHDALPISTTPPTPNAVIPNSRYGPSAAPTPPAHSRNFVPSPPTANRSEEHTSELQSRLHLVCRLLLEKKKKHKRHREQQDNTLNQRPPNH